MPIKILSSASLALVLTACATGPKPDKPTEPPINFTKSENFLIVLKGVSGPATVTSYEFPISENYWAFLTEIHGVKYYVEKKTLDVNEKTKTVSFKTLYDTRPFRRNIMDEFGYSEFFDIRMPPFVTYYAKVNCESKTSWTGIRQGLTEEMKPIELITDDQVGGTVLIRNSISDSICFALDMINT